MRFARRCVWMKPPNIGQHPVAVLGEVREPLPMQPRCGQQPGQPERFDNEYERHGTCALFMLFEPLAGQRQVMVRERRTACDSVTMLMCCVSCATRFMLRPSKLYWCRIISIHMMRTVCMRRSRQRRRTASPTDLSGTRHPSMVLGSTWPRLS